MKKFLLILLLILSVSVLPVFAVMTRVDYTITFIDGYKWDLDTGIYTADPTWATTDRTVINGNDLKIDTAIHFHHCVFFTATNEYLGYCNGADTTYAGLKYLGDFVGLTVVIPAGATKFALMVDKLGVNREIPGYELTDKTYTGLINAPAIGPFTNLIVNGTFTDDIANWNNSGGTAIWDNGRIYADGAIAFNTVSLSALPQDDYFTRMDYEVTADLVGYAEASGNAIMDLSTVGRVEFDGDAGETWTTSIVWDKTNSTIFGINLPTDSDVHTNSTLDCISNYFVQKTAAALDTFDSEGFYFYNSGATHISRYRVDKYRMTGWDDGWTDDQKVTAFKTWLSANNLVVYYKLSGVDPAFTFSDLKTSLTYFSSNNLWLTTSWDWADKTNMPDQTDALFNGIEDDFYTTGTYSLGGARNTLTLPAPNDLDFSYVVDPGGTAFGLTAEYGTGYLSRFGSVSAIEDPLLLEWSVWTPTWIDNVIAYDLDEFDAIGDDLYNPQYTDYWNNMNYVGADQLALINDWIDLNWVYIDETHYMAVAQSIVVTNYAQWLADYNHYNLYTPISFATFDNSIAYADVDIPAEDNRTVIEKINDYFTDLGAGAAYIKTIVAIVIMLVFVVALAILKAPRPIILLTGVLLFVLFSVFGWLPAWLIILVAIIIFFVAFFQFKAMTGGGGGE